ncbi:uncharacterized protein F5891DRAFT_987432 [Suillus fuscotomentosus]|uniref:Uncharacterized protein n=1 Tax=Suillus fuscotomentosus TaxID=1912939 RepID=A0AAD4DQ92_9AGAM|nr:uncharacterized protein F5891DRAFT_987432 [Suillus fuscotomentosus]KAG1889119.1 hypothetical protein F5891DRAFT_987432 [Suillus fuscotomentosus]
MPTLSEITEMASALVLQAPGTDAPLDVLGDWGREVARFLTWLDAEERKVLFTLTAVSQLHTTFQEQVDARLHYPWRSWGRQWLPLTAEAWEAKMQALMGNPVIRDPLASTQLSSLAIIALLDPSNEGKGGNRAGAGDEITDEKSTHHTRTSQAKCPREEALQGDISSDVQTPSSFADRPSNRPRLPPSVKKPLRRMPPSKPRSFNELMQDSNLRDPRVVVLECKRCEKKKPSATKLCLTVLRLCSQTDEYELSNSCMRCIVDHQKCEWPAGAISKNIGHRVHVSAKYFSPTEDQSAAPKSLGPTLTQSGACASHVVINLPHKNTVKVTSSAQPAPGPSSATTAEQVKHTSDIIQLPTPKRSISPISTWIMELM